MEKNIDLKPFLNITKLENQLDELKKERERICTPKIKDLREIEVIRDFFIKSTSENQRKKSNRNILDKQFVFIALYLFDPSSLFPKNNIKYGIAKELARIMNIRCGSIISRHSSDVMFFYIHYEDFRKEVDELYEKTMTKYEEMKNTQAI